MSRPCRLATGGAQPTEAGRSLSLSLHALKDLMRPDLRAEARDPDMPGEIRDWLQRAVQAIARDPALRNLEDQGAVPVAGSLGHIQIILCHPDDAVEIFDADPETLGLHLVSNPDSDPFADNSPYARAWRILIPWDQARLADMVLRDWEDDGFLDPEEAALSWIATVGHEIGHVRLFAENGNFNSPQDLDLLEDEIGHDLFDISTGYGIRPLPIGRRLVEARSAEHAHQLMEWYVEEVGRAICARQIASAIPELVGILRELETSPSP